MLEHQTQHGVQYGVFRCESCRDEGCGDSCGVEFADELPALGDDFWPACKCCGLPVALVAPLVTN